MSWKKFVTLAIAIPLVVVSAQPAFADNGATDDPLVQAGMSAQAKPAPGTTTADPSAPTTDQQDQSGTADEPGTDPGTNGGSGQGADPEAPNGGESEQPTPGSEPPSTESPQPEAPPTPAPQPKTGATKQSPKPITAQAAEPVESLKVSGVLHVAPGEPTQGSVAASDAGGAVDMLPDQVKLETAEGTTLPLDPESLGEDVSGGEAFSGTVSLDDAAQQAVQEVVEDSTATAQKAPDLAVVVEAAATATIAAGETFDAKEVEITPAPAQTKGPAAMQHSADVVLITSATASQESAVRDLMTLTSNYWKKESEGLITGISVNAVKQLSSAGMDVCDPNAAWEAARDQFPGVDHYENARHLVVLVDKNCGPGAAAGWGDIYTLHGGGEIYANLGARYSGTSFRDALGIVAHEFGHNFGLDHSGSRTCNADAYDAALSNVWIFDPQTRASGQLCTDDEYRDSWSVMGYYRPDLGPVLPSLPISQKADIELLPATAIPKVTQAAGKTQRFTIKALSSGSGLRGIQVQQSGSSEPFYVEYRSGTGQDSGANFMDPSQRGVRILKQYDRGSIVISKADGYSLGKGDFLQPYGGRARVIVESETSASANVRVDFYTSFRDVPASHKFAGPIQWMYDTKTSTGTRQVDGSAVYGPSENVTRGAIAAFLFRSEAPSGYKPGSKGKLPFTDVSTGHKFYKEIYWMWEKGITTGTRQANGTVKFLPNDSLTREAMAAFLYRVNGAKYSPPAKSPFKDVSTKQQFYRQITWMYSKQITTGTATSRGLEYQPKNLTSRAAMAAFMQRSSKL
ncbi:hypothetical protein G7068_03885 [Leucobacter viscericola]|uniref:SLH domain-containing protein n=1 Tax=Leucobacter viscericola TaxID=2714935 RepID=A0A6G7XDH0_9MICO|nr:S-layer homology domain-containing protein [Leucobacter viscericola]QIK62447.1 hypothetical protein G7068_03885 [Leucobacter viscericola]